MIHQESHVSKSTCSGPESERTENHWMEEGQARRSNVSKNSRSCLSIMIHPLTKTLCASSFASILAHIGFLILLGGYILYITYLEFSIVLLICYIIAGLLPFSLIGLTILLSNCCSKKEYKINCCSKASGDVNGDVNLSSENQLNPFIEHVENDNLADGLSLQSITYSGEQGYRNRYNLIERLFGSCNFCEVYFTKTKVSHFGTSEGFIYQFTKTFHEFELLPNSCCLIEDIFSKSIKVIIYVHN